MAPRCEIFSQGEEIVTGQTVDSNAAWLSQQLIAAGFELTRHTAVGDHLEALVGLLIEISERADCCICTGGLGPTGDDLTAEAVAEAFGAPLEFDAEAMDQVESIFKLWNRPMPAVNRKQAYFPSGAVRIDNKWGTAPGFTVNHNGCQFYFLPGVPSEMKKMFQAGVFPQLQESFSLSPLKKVTFRTFGLGESAIQERIESIVFPEMVTVSFRAGLPEVELKLWFPPEQDQQEIEVLSSAIASALGNQLISVSDGFGPPKGIVEVVSELLTEQNHKVALLETVSSGLLASWCVTRPWLLESRVIPSSELLNRDFELEGCSETERALSLAKLVRQKSGADYGLVQLWSFDPSLLKEKRRSMELVTALSTCDGETHHITKVGGSLDRKQNIAAASLLNLLRFHLGTAY
ncbi:MAG: competence/damage-inducible protein A [Gammaproteobacteria bacterium]|nr:MAG: competence/damage-inducible protein A [Gammaproteobacteria bacterium]